MSPGFWFAIAIIIFTLLVFIVSVVNAIYFYRISRSTILQTASNTNVATTLPITAGEANVLFWVNVIWAVLALIGIGASGYMAYLLSKPVVCVSPAISPLVSPIAPLISPIAQSLYNTACNTCTRNPITSSLDSGSACAINRVSPSLVY